MEKATFAAGCFWGVEATFKKQIGVKETLVGYTGGNKENPTYEEVCTGNTGHAEAIEILFDPTETSYEKLLSVFFESHDPTTPNRQGPDVGTQYRSAIFYHSEQQKKLASEAKRTKEKSLQVAVVTEIVAAAEFFAAEAYHQNYFEKQGR